MFRKQAGFGVVEVLVTIVLLGVVSLSLTVMFRNILYIQVSARHHKSATLAAQRQIEALRNSNFNQLDAGVPVNFTSDLPDDLPGPKSGVANVTEPVSGLKRVDVTVTYHAYGKDRTVKVSSMIGLIGISQ